MAVQSTNTLNATLLSVDQNNNTLVNRTTGSPSFVGTAAELVSSLKVASTGTAITLPVSPCKQVYIKNLSTTSNLTITLTPNGGASAIASVLSPGSAFIIWDVGTGQGITALTLTHVTNNEPAEYFIGG